MRDDIQRFLHNRHIDVLIPMKGDEALLIGFLGIGEKEKGWYAHEDIEFLKTFSATLAMRFSEVVNYEQAKKRIPLFVKYHR